MTEIPITFDNEDDLIIHRTIQYETYAASPEDAETTARMFVRFLEETRSEHIQSRVQQSLRLEVSSYHRSANQGLGDTKHHDHLDSDEICLSFIKGDRDG